MKQNNDFLSPPTNPNDNQNYETKIQELQAQMNQVISPINLLTKEVASSQAAGKAAPVQSQPVSSIPEIDAQSRRFYHKSYRNPNNAYSADYAELLEQNRMLESEVAELKNKLNYAKQREGMLKQYEWDGRDFTPGQMNRNMQLVLTGSNKPPYRMTLNYPIRCTHDDTEHYIFGPEDAYDDTFPLGVYGRDIFCKKCFNKYVMPKRIELAKEEIIRKQKKREQNR